MSMTDKIIEEINKCNTRDDVVEHYKYACHITGIEWDRINDAIIKKWSMSGLKYIKKSVWC